MFMMNNKIMVSPGDVLMILFMPVWEPVVETQKPGPLIMDQTDVEIVNSMGL